MYPIKQSTAITVPFFVHDANGDGVASLTDGSFTKRISKNGAAFGAMTVTITEMENGWYSIPLSASHSDTLGLLTVVFTNAGAKQVNLQWRVESKLRDDLNDVAATDIVSSGAITTSGGAVSTVSTLTGHTAQTGDSFARLGAPAGVSIAADIATVDTVVDGIQTDLDNGTDGLGAIKADTAAILTDTGTTLENHLTDIKGATFSGVTDSLEAIRNQGDAAWITATGFSTHTAADVRTEMDANSTQLTAIVADTNELQTDDVPGLIAALNDPTAATTAAAVWDALQASHVTVGSFGEIATEIASILADTNELQSDDVPGLIAALNDIAATDVWAAATRTLTASTNFNDISTADVLTQVNAALDTAISELGVAAPTATPTLRTGLMLLYMMARNKLVVQTSGTDALEVYNDAGTKIASKLITDDGSDYTEAEMA